MERVIGAADLGNVILKTDGLMKDISQIGIYKKFVQGVFLSEEDQQDIQEDISENYSVQTTGLISKVKVFEKQIDSLKSLISSPTFQKEQRDQYQPDSTSTERKQEIKILNAEKQRLESYLKIYSQRINSLSTVILHYQNQFKFLLDKLKNKKSNQKGTFSNLKFIGLDLNPSLKSPNNDEDDESFSQYRGISFKINKSSFFL